MINEAQTLLLNVSLLTRCNKVLLQGEISSPYTPYCGLSNVYMNPIRVFPPSSYWETRCGATLLSLSLFARFFLSLPEVAVARCIPFEPP